MPMQAPIKLLAATCPVLCPEGRGRAYGTKWEHHHGMPKGKKCKEVQVVRRHPKKGGSC